MTTTTTPHLVTDDGKDEQTYRVARGVLVRAVKAVARTALACDTHAPADRIDADLRAMMRDLGRALRANDYLLSIEEDDIQLRKDIEEGNA